MRNNTNVLDALSAAFFANNSYSNGIADFCKDPAGNQSNYTRLYNQLMTFIADVNSNSISGFNFPAISSLRLLLTVSYGTVALDTNRSSPSTAVPSTATVGGGIGNGTGNLYANFIAQCIGVNHNTRIRSIQALFNDSGRGYETKYSTSGSGSSEDYLAVRLGNNTQEPLGLVHFTYRI